MTFTVEVENLCEDAIMNSDNSLVLADMIASDDVSVT